MDDVTSTHSTIGSNSRQTSDELKSPAIQQARLDLAACFRMAARLGLHEGICNHFSALVPGHPRLFLVNPLGYAFDEITASSLLICNFDGEVLAGKGEPESTAFHIHGQVHLHHPHAVACFHTHMPNATALSMLEGPPLRWAGQTSLRFYGRLAVEERFGGLALDNREGERIAAALGSANVIFLKNHGVMVAARSIAQAWDDLYYLERVCEVERLALSTGVPLKPVDPQIARLTFEQMESGAEEASQLHLESIKRRLDKLEPDYRD
ncbi:ribulose-5-phosphate 4-epimerase/fuculose-1-phosphate aldolase [Paraburkholderia sp. 32]